MMFLLLCYYSSLVLYFKTLLTITMLGGDDYDKLPCAPSALLDHRKHNNALICILICFRIQEGKLVCITYEIVRKALETMVFRSLIIALSQPYHSLI